MALFLTLGLFVAITWCIETVYDCNSEFFLRLLDILSIPAIISPSISSHGHSMHRLVLAQFQNAKLLTNEFSLTVVVEISILYLAVAFVSQRLSLFLLLTPRSRRRS
jgi:hypothetical protein